MAMYEPFNKTLGNRIRNFYEDYKEYIQNGILVLATIAALSPICYQTNREIKKDLERYNPINKKFYMPERPLKSEILDKHSIENKLEQQQK